MRLVIIFLVVEFGMLGFGMTGASARSHDSALTVAVAASATPAFEEIGAAFDDQFGVKVTIVEGSSGGLYTQILNGAPFDIFVAADTWYPGHLLAAGKVAPGTGVVRYAEGRLVAWMPGSHCRPDCFSALRHLHRPLAIANPSLAPYGVAAEDCLQSGGLSGLSRVIGSNVAQAYQFVASGNAGGGLVALSQITLGKSRGMVNDLDYSVVSERCHKPLIQGLVILSATRDRSLAERFVNFVSAPSSRKVLQKFGFRSAGQ